MELQDRFLQNEKYPFFSRNIFRSAMLIQKPSFLKWEVFGLAKFQDDLVIHHDISEVCPDVASLVLKGEHLLPLKRDTCDFQLYAQGLLVRMLQEPRAEQVVDCVCHAQQFAAQLFVFEGFHKNLLNDLLRREALPARPVRKRPELINPIVQVQKIGDSDYFPFALSAKYYLNKNHIDGVPLSIVTFALCFAHLTHEGRAAGRASLTKRIQEGFYGTTLKSKS